MKKNKFDKILSLGYNCEVAFRIWDNFGGVESYPFTWSFISDYSLLADIIGSLKSITSEPYEIGSNGMVKFLTHKISFHLKNKESLFDKKGNLIDNEAKNQMDEFVSRYNHLCDKFYDLLNSDLKTLFVIKIHDKIEFNDLDRIIDYLKNNYKSKNFRVLAVLEEKNRAELKYKNKYVDIMFLKNFASDVETKEGGDKDGWKDIFSHYQIKKVKKQNIFSRVFSSFKNNGFKVTMKKIFKKIFRKK